MMTYPEGKLIWGIPILLLAAFIEFAVRKIMPQKTGMAGWRQEKRIGTLTALIALSILTVIYFLTKA